MAGVRADGAAGPDVLTLFDRLRSAKPRADVSLEEVVPPGQRIAPFGFATEASLFGPEASPPAQGGSDAEPAPLAAGRFIVLHDPAGKAEWFGGWRIVTMVTAGIDESMAHDPLLAEVTWSWLVEAVQGRGVGFQAERGTVTVTTSRRFGPPAPVDAPSAADDVSCEVELRCSWSPLSADDIPAHLAAFCDLLGAVAGVPADPGMRPLAPLHRLVR